MGEKRASAGLGHRSHVVEFLFLAFERRSQELLHLYAGRSGDPLHHPVPDVEGNQNDQHNLEDVSPTPLHVASYRTPISYVKLCGDYTPWFYDENIAH